MHAAAGCACRAVEQHACTRQAAPAEHACGASSGDRASSVSGDAAHAVCLLVLLVLVLLRVLAILLLLVDGHARMTDCTGGRMVAPHEHVGRSVMLVLQRIVADAFFPRVPQGGVVTHAEVAKSSCCCCQWHARRSVTVYEPFWLNESSSSSYSIHPGD